MREILHVDFNIMKNTLSRVNTTDEEEYRETLTQNPVQNISASYFTPRSKIKFNSAKRKLVSRWWF